MQDSQSKRLAAQEALKLIRSGMTVGLGTGSTATIFIQLLGEALAQKKLANIIGVPTSVQSDQLARSLGIPIVEFSHDHPVCDVTIDGADEIDDGLDLIKGLGGALLREKVVAQNSRKLVIIADESKRVSKLGTRGQLPVEVTKFALSAHEMYLESLGCTPTLRRAKDGSPFVTDNGNHIFDCKFQNGIEDAPKLAEQLSTRAGIVEHGLFIGLATQAFIGMSDGTCVKL
ncbi:MAG TPA: ribose 5-phosphate isomerase A [Tepidisphaeraceae bacterium]|nr:ribose 5-phosphate isomerase A [Tepidisphaeraceae bacterium]